MKNKILINERRRAKGVYQKKFLEEKKIGIFIFRQSKQTYNDVSEDYAIQKKKPS